MKQNNYFLNGGGGGATPPCNVIIYNYKLYINATCLVWNVQCPRKYYYLWRPKEDPLETDVFGRRSTLSETYMPHRRPIEDRHAWSTISMGLRWGMLVSDGSSIRHVGILWFSDQTCRSPSTMGLRWVSDKSLIIIIFSWTHFYLENITSTKPPESLCGAKRKYLLSPKK